MIFSNISDSEAPSGFSRKDDGLGFILKPFLFIVFIWLVFWLDNRLMLDLYRFGIFPRQIDGLVGVVASPLLHGSVSHLTNNTLPILALGMGMFFFYPRIAIIVILSAWLSSGVLVWLIGRESYHIGASGLIYALAGFIFLSGLLRKQGNLLALSLLVVFLYGGLVWGVLPVKESVSWEAHLAGALSGFTLAIIYRKTGPRRKQYSWDLEELEEEPIEIIQVQKPQVEQKEVWEDYAKSVHGIRYIYRPKNDSEHR